MHSCFTNTCMFPNALMFHTWPHVSHMTSCFTHDLMFHTRPHVSHMISCFTHDLMFHNLRDLYIIIINDGKFSNHEEHVFSKVKQKNLPVQKNVVYEIHVEDTCPVPHWLLLSAVPLCGRSPEDRISPKNLYNKNPWTEESKLLAEAETNENVFPRNSN